MAEDKSISESFNKSLTDDFVKEQGNRHITRKEWNNFSEAQRQALAKDAGEGGKRSVARLNKADQIAAGTYEGYSGGKKSAPEVVPPAPPPVPQEDTSFAINKAMGDRKAKLRNSSGFRSNVYTSNQGLTDLAAKRQPDKVQ